MSTRDDVLRALFTSIPLDQFQNPMAVTLTMRKRASGLTCGHMEASRNFRHFMNRVNRRIFGSASKRYGKKLQVFPVLESNADDRLHYHILVDRPDRITAAEFDSLIREEWSQTTFGYHEVDVKPVHDDGWLSYLCKGRQKPGGLLDSIDWNNCTSTLG